MKFKCLVLLILVNLGFIISANDLLLFEGVGGKFNGRDSFVIPLGNQLDYLKNHPNMQTQNGVIVGHSQGGLRAVALSGYIKRNSISNTKLNTIITIGAPVQGFSPLLKGVGGLRNEVRGAANTLTNAINIAAGKVGMNPNLSVDSILEASGLKGGMMGLVTDQNNNGEGTSIPDMHPNSAFIRNNIYSVDIKVKVVKVQVGRGQFKPIFIVEKKEKFQLPTDVKYGFIVGKNSDVLELAHDMGVLKDKLSFNVGGFKFSVHPKTANNWLVTGLSLASTAYALDEASHRFWQNIHWLKFWDHRDYRREKALGDHCARKKREIDAGKNWAKNYEANFSKILGTKVGENDSFIPVKDQSIDVNKFGGITVDNKNGRFESANLHHVNEATSREVWGTGGSLAGAKIGPGGKLDAWLQIKKPEDRTGTLIR